jgi:glycosyltransferase involved in cell wall biosynthesis
MKAAIFNPYLDTLGGGERYTLTFAKVLSDNGWEVDLEWKDVRIKKSLEDRFGMDLTKINIVNDIKRGDGYDLCFWVSDGSIPALKARKNILHFQVPFQNVNGRSLLNKMKLFRVSKVICNSNFTKKFIDREYGINSLVVYPPVDTVSIKPKRKENIILYVGRFSQLTQSKRQDILVSAFKKLLNKGLVDWKLILTGGVEVGVDNYLEELKKMSKDHPIEIIPSPDFETLKDLYGKAKIFWSASGFGVNENKNPEKVEHFGMTVVEAMAAGAVPIVYNAGGHKEIIVEAENGQLWETTANLIKQTWNLINNNKSLRGLAAKARGSSEKYSETGFEKKIFSDILQR